MLTVIVGIASCGRLDNLYLPANRHYHQSSDYSTTNTYTSNTGTHSDLQRSGHYYGEAQSGPIDRASNDVPILRLVVNNDGETYNYALETGNGISAQEQGDASGDGTRAQGSYSYTAPDGQLIQVQYTSDENGFLPQGSHLPVTPPVPEEILKSIEQNLADEARGIFDDGQYREEGSNYQKYNAATASPYKEEARNNDGKYNARNTLAVTKHFSRINNNLYIPPPVTRQN